jgi:hypothetical protein
MYTFQQTLKTLGLGSPIIEFSARSQLPQFGAAVLQCCSQSQIAGKGSSMLLTLVLSRDGGVTSI